MFRVEFTNAFGRSCYVLTNDPFDTMARIVYVGGTIVEVI